MDSAQDCADRALEQGRAAQAKIDSLSRQLSAATAAASSAGGTVSALSRPPLPGAEPPDPVQVLAATHNATTANTRVSTLSSGPGGAQDRLTADKNSWGSDGYQGSNSTWRDPHTGQTFEVQVHTPDSLAARESAHSLYEAERVLLLGSPEQLELAAH